MPDKGDIFKYLENVLVLKKYTIFSDLNTDELRALALISKEVTVQDGFCVVRENDAGDSFFIVKKGVLRVVKGDKSAHAELAMLVPYNVFGEMALFEEGRLRSASIYAKGECTLLIFKRDDFFEALRRFPGISLSLLKISAERLRDSNKKFLEATRKL